MSRLPPQSLAATVAVVIPVAVFAAAAWDRRWMSDDGFIYLRVVDQLRAGNGPVFNAGERVEATTGPLWVAVLTLASALPVSLEWLAVGLGLLLSLTGLTLAAWGALRLMERDRYRLMLPLGAIVVVALPPFWDFATSGLETGLGFAWLGACFWGLAREYQFGLYEGYRTGPKGLLETGREILGAINDWRLGRPHTGRELPRLSLGPADLGNYLDGSGSPKWLAVLIGLGPLIRPDFIIFTVAFMVAFFVLYPGQSWRRRLGIVVVALALPLSFQVFRTGYYGALVPHPAFAKEASEPYWSQGWEYVDNLFRTYWLWVPLIGLALLSWGPSQIQRLNRRDRAGLVLAVIPVAAALVYALYITRLGGDFMHGRLLLPAVFALLLPVAVIPISNPLNLVAALVVVPWAVISASTLRYEDCDPLGICDAHGWSVELAQHPHPVTLDDYDQQPASPLEQPVSPQASPQYAAAGLAARILATEDRHVLLLRDPTPGGIFSPGQIPLSPGIDAGLVVQTGVLGMFSYAAGTDVHVVDVHGLADPIAGRLRLEHRGRPGHEKVLAEAWVVARFADPGSQLPSAAPSAEAVAAAREALACGRPHQLLEAVQEPLTPERFVRNIIASIGLHSLRIDPDPVRAAQEVC